MSRMDEVLYVINPRSNEGNSVRLWQKTIKRYPFLPIKPIDITTVSLETVIKERNPRLLVIAGGDGTINAVSRIVVGLSKKPILAIIPFGFGNAISYCLGAETIEKALSIIQQSKHTVTIDLLKTNIPKHSVGVFSVSVGFDARTVFNRQHYRYIGFRSYILSALRSFVLHPEQEITFTIDKKVTLTAWASSLVIANCPVIGQNYIVSPNAKFNDGLLDCTMFSTKYDYITNLRFRGFKHPLYSELGKVRFKARHIRIEGEPYVQIDGDPVVQRESVEIEIMPSQLTFLRNTDEQINQMYLPFVTK
ncbi:MAG TPA: diacylglycerol kinase family protein [Candidatus Sulfotelmatobacter sp.]|jgi:diacylglycerol kinase family enzyme|nr:diacylglycerol kinase family protein [Candidatus Sulfotelmatobacter sp.]